MISMPQMTGRPDYNWEEFATDKSFEKMKSDREEQTNAWSEKIKIPVIMEEAFPKHLKMQVQLGLLL